MVRKTAGMRAERSAIYADCALSTVTVCSRATLMAVFSPHQTTMSTEIKHFSGEMFNQFERFTLNSLHSHKGQRCRTRGCD